MSDSLWPHELQHSRPPCPPPIPGVHPNPYPLNWWCHPTISSFVIPFSSSPQSFPTSGSFLMSQFFASSGQSVGVSASAEKKKQTKPFTLVNNLSGMGFCLRHEIEVTFFFCVDLNWPSIIYWQDHPFSSLLWCQHGEKSSDHMHMNCSRTLFCSIGLSTIVTTPHRLIILH